jgi:hypothetical protein
MISPTMTMTGVTPSFVETGMLKKTVLQLMMHTATMTIRLK